MSISTKTLRRFTGMLVLGGAVLASGGQPAWAGHQDLGTRAALQQPQGVGPNARPAAPAGIRKPSGQDASDALERFLRNDRTHVRPDDRAGARGVGAQTSVTDRSDVVSRYLGRVRAAGRVAVGGTPATTGPVLQAPVATSSRFDWRDAGIGAGGTLATMLVVLGSAIVLLRRTTLGTRMLSR